MKKENNLLIYTSYKVPGIVVLFIMIFFSACSKTQEDTPAISSTTPPILSAPSGDIQTFVLSDTLVAFGGSAVAKWLVTGTNNQTIVTFNGVKVGFYGDLDTGPQKQNTTFTLAINNGKKATASIQVVDSITTLMWNNGKRLKKVRSQVSNIVAGQASQFRDTGILARIADQRINFRLAGTSAIIQVSSIYVSDLEAGTFVVNASHTGFSWRGIIYTFVTLDYKSMVVTYNTVQPDGTPILMKDYYDFE